MTVAPAYDRVMARVVPGHDCCLIYTGACVLGYGVVKDNGPQRKVHVVVYEHHHGKVPHGLELDHLCHNRDETCLGGPACLHRRCVNLRHLEAVPHAVNAARGNNAHRDATHCGQGHEYTPENTYSPDGKRRYCRTCRRNYQRAHRLGSGHKV